MRHRPIRTLLATVFGLPAAACGGGSTPPPPPPPAIPAIVGSYQLSSIAGFDVPAVLNMLSRQEDQVLPIELGCETIVTDGTLDVLADGTYSRTETTLDGDCDDPADDLPPVTRAWSGTWVLNGSQVSVEGFGSSSTSADGTFIGDEISLTYVTGLIVQADTVRVFRR